MQIAGISAVITGAGSGLGLATAKTMAAAGANVVIVDLPSSNGEAEAAAIGPNAVFVAADVRDEDQIKVALDAAEDMGPLRLVVNCAGIATPNRVMRKGVATAQAEFERVISINLLGTLNVIRLAAERMSVTEPAGEERGVIVNTASVAAFDGQVGQVAYAASKAGVAGMTLPLARDLAQFLIRVIAVAPGTFETPMVAGLPPEAVKSLGDQVPHPSRLGKPEEYAALVKHIVENPMINGETIRIDGAIRMAPR
ncbi:MAG: SDR family NAD(P)-dependent oxidoreductase [Candidatus Nanopelagicales bacterium]|nr:SDR family NAD(P)-dependent oxidoreductase [Candidatus Nanopelagicales bacterium]